MILIADITCRHSSVSACRFGLIQLYRWTGDTQVTQAGYKNTPVRGYAT